MQEDALDRLELLTGAEAVARLKRAAFLVCGLGGVGSWAAEALARCGAGTVMLADCDTVRPSNLNRQAEALHSTLGLAKCDALADRLQDISPAAEILRHRERIAPEDIPALLEARPWDAVIDAIDDRVAKLALLEECVRRGIRVISSMGAANKVHPERITVCDLAETQGCPLARLIRKNLRKRGIERGVTCVYSPEPPVLHPDGARDLPSERRPLGSLVTVTAAFGLRCAHLAVAPLLRLDELPCKGHDIADGDLTFPK